MIRWCGEIHVTVLALFCTVAGLESYSPTQDLSRTHEFVEIVDTSFSETHDFELTLTLSPTQGIQEPSGEGVAVL